MAAASNRSGCCREFLRTPWLLLATFRRLRRDPGHLRVALLQDGDPGSHEALTSLARDRSHDLRRLLHCLGGPRLGVRRPVGEPYLADLLRCPALAAHPRGPAALVELAGDRLVGLVQERAQEVDLLDDRGVYRAAGSHERG